jgi:hypothetical protein
MVSIIRHVYNSILAMQLLLCTTYSSTLDNHSAIYARELCPSSNYFYEALAFNVSIAGNYSFWSHSEIDTHGYLYRDIFNPFQPAVYRISSNDDSCKNGQFLIVDRLLTNTRYILVVTTQWIDVTGRFSVIYDGPTSIQLVRLSKCVYSAIPNEISCLISNIESEESIF